MNKGRMLVRGTVGALGLVLSQAVSAKDITIFDTVKQNNNAWYGGTGNADGRPGLLEDQETEPGTVTSQAWDLEAFHLNGTTLSMIGGFNFLAGNQGQASGDIFIDINGDAKWGMGATGTPAGTVNNVPYNLNNSLFNYDYVIAFAVRGDQTIGNGSTQADYQVYQLSGNSVVEASVGVGINDESNPWKYVSGGTPIGTSKRATQANLGSTDYMGLKGGTHYELGNIDLSFLGNGLSAGTLFKFTMECGNDNLVGRVPDGGTTLMLLGMGVGGLAFVSRRTRK